jgi:hypothetical protein
MIDEFWSFPTIGPKRPNIYHRCKYCKKTVPAINYSLKGHLTDCAWSNMVCAILEDKEVIYCPNWSDSVFEYMVDGIVSSFETPLDLEEVCKRKFGTQSKEYREFIEQGGILNQKE